MTVLEPTLLLELFVAERMGRKVLLFKTAHGAQFEPSSRTKPLFLNSAPGDESLGETIAETLRGETESSRRKSPTGRKILSHPAKLFVSGTKRKGDSPQPLRAY
jgi:hypothetical protein